MFSLFLLQGLCLLFCLRGPGCLHHYGVCSFLQKTVHCKVLHGCSEIYLQLWTCRYRCRISESRGRLFPVTLQETPSLQSQDNPPTAECRSQNPDTHAPSLSEQRLLHSSFQARRDLNQLR